MTASEGDNFWKARRAWVYALGTGLRGAVAILLTLVITWSVAWIFRTETPFLPWIRTALVVGVIVGLALLPVFTVWARWDLWRTNRVMTK